MGQVFIFSFSEESRNDHLPEYPIEHLETEHISRIQNNANARDYLKTIIDILNAQELYRRFISLIDIAVVIKHVLVSERIPIEIVCRIDETLMQYDINRIVDESIFEVQRILFAKYVETQKVSEELFNHYSSAIEDILTDVYVRNNGTVTSHPEYLKRYIKGLTTEQYRTVHRTHFEHMVRVAKTSVKEKLKELL